MGKYSITIDGKSNIGALAVGSGATAIGSSTSSGVSAATTCSQCGASIKADRKDCEFCHTAYPNGVGGNTGKVSIEYED